MTYALEGRRVVVTGATGGIGRVLAANLAVRGVDLVLIARDPDRLAAVAGELPGACNVTIAFDVSDERSWQKNASRIAPEGTLDGLVTAAAILPPVGPVGTWSVEEFRRSFDVNVGGTLLAISVLLGPLRARRGSIVTFSGGGGTGPFPRFDAYAASKAAIVRLTENIAHELSADGVRANSIAPGFVMSEMHQAALTAGPDVVGRQYFDRILQATASGRWDPPEAAADLVAFLLSEASRGISGKLLSAQWDPWREPEFQRRLAEDPNLATLRRIDSQLFVARTDVTA